MTYALVRKVRAARKINIPDSSTVTHKMLHRPIRQVLTVAEVKVVQIFSEPADAVDHGSIRDIPAFCQNKIAEAWRNVDNFVDAVIGQELTTGEVENTEALIVSAGELEKGFVCEKIAVS